VKKTILSHLDLSEELYQVFLNSAKYKKAPKHQILFSPPKSNQKFLFITEGLLRAYQIIDGKDYTHHFYFPNWFATDYKSYLTNEPSQLFIETLTAVEYYEFDKITLLKLFEAHHLFEKLGRIIAEKAFLLTVEKFSDMQTQNLKERYESLIKKNPTLFQKVAQKYIASYLGVSEQSLSRIKSQCS